LLLPLAISLWLQYNNKTPMDFNLPGFYVFYAMNRTIVKSFLTIKKLHAISLLLLFLKHLAGGNGFILLSLVSALLPAM
jgi:hypothetical protein